MSSLFWDALHADVYLCEVVDDVQLNESCLSVQVLWPVQLPLLFASTDISRRMKLLLHYTTPDRCTRDDAAAAASTTTLCSQPQTHADDVALPAFAAKANKYHDDDEVRKSHSINISPSCWAEIVSYRVALYICIWCWAESWQNMGTVKSSKYLIASIFTFDSPLSVRVYWPVWFSNFSSVLFSLYAV